VWRVENGSKIRLREDPWMGCNDDYRLPVHMVLFLGERGFLNLGQIADHEISSIWRQVWLSADRIG
jgi:hypothetical protein